ncbi:MAG TPA: 1-(5-phosphoribosyl)-5-[(5-phosphoribosylamino)methylideneamino]imidazole-4-carboxamide isomerase [Planctomycetota bacterium]|nr:1-(5-phosphoribosyl)-5-[(5-phosphoribosylamino)methylideneamino]imidazole-4-carboxamide isomerase [Planctomycetota bacterium]
MRIIPAVDMKDGKAVRLKQGKADQQTIYDTDPVHAARRWFDAGARRIHIVDLDGAFEGVPKNRAFTLEILKAFASQVEIQIGGGLRDEKTIEEYLSAGAARCVIGTKALEDRSFLEHLARKFPGRINVGIDAKDGKVVTKGWVAQSQTLATDLVRSLGGLALGEIIYTDIETDGMLKGPNLKQLTEMKKASPFPLIASGGVTTVENVKACRELGCFGAIVGKAFYDGALDIAAAFKAAGE